MPIPSLTELTSGKGSPELAFGSGYAGGVPPLNIDFSNTEKRINEIADQAAKQKQADKAAFEKTLTSKLQSIGKYDGVLPEDRQELQSLNNQVRSEIIKNSYLYAPGALSSDANKNKLAELEDKIAEYSAKVDKSKQDKKFEEQLNVTLRNRPEYNNEETEALLQEWRSKKVDERTPFMPVDSGDKELMLLEKEFYSKPRDFIQKEEPSENDPMSYYSATYGVFDPEAYRNIYKRARGKFHASTYRRSPELQAQWEQDGMGGYEGYVNSLADANMKGKGEADALLIQRVKKERNESKLEEGRNTRQQNAIDAGWGKTRYVQDNVNQRFENKPKTPTTEEKNTAYVNDMVEVLEGIEGEWNVKRDGLVKSYPYFDSFTPKDVVSLEQLPKNETGVDFSKIFPGGKDQYGDAYNVLFRLTKKNGEVLYAPAREIYSYEKGKDVITTTSKKEMEAAFGKKYKMVVPNMSEAFTPEHLAMRVLNISDVKYEPNQDGESEDDNTPISPPKPAKKRTKSTPMFDANGNRIK